MDAGTPVQPERIPGEAQGAPKAVSEAKTEGETKSALAARERREKKNAEQASEKMSKGLFDRLKGVGSLAKGAVEGVTEKETIADAAGAAAGGPIWDAAKEMKDVASELGESGRDEDSILNKALRKTGLLKNRKALFAAADADEEMGSDEPEQGDVGKGKRDKQGRFLKKGNKKGGKKDGDMLVADTLEDNEKAAEKRHRQLVNAVTDSSDEDGIDLPGRRKKGGPDIDLGRRGKNKGGSRVGKAIKAGKGGLLSKVGKIAGGALAGKAALLAAAGAAGYGVGTLINKGMGKLTGGGDDWAADIVHEKVDKRRQAKHDQTLKDKYADKKKNFSPAAIELMGGEKGFDINQTMPLLQSGELVKKGGKIVTAEEARAIPDVADAVKETPVEKSPEAVAQASPVTETLPSPAVTATEARPSSSAAVPIAAPEPVRPATPQKIEPDQAQIPGSNIISGRDKNIESVVGRLAQTIEKYIKDGSRKSDPGSGKEHPVIRDGFDDTILNLMAHDRI